MFLQVLEGADQLAGQTVYSIHRLNSVPSSIGIIRSFALFFSVRHPQCRSRDGLVSRRQQAPEILADEAGLSETPQYRKLHQGFFDRYLYGIESGFCLPETFEPLFERWCLWFRIDGSFVLHSLVAAPRCQGTAQLLPGAAAQPEEQEWVLVEPVAQDEVYGGYVLADPRRVRAAATGPDLTAPVGEEADPHHLERLLYVSWHLAGQELGREERTFCESLRYALPLIFAQMPERNVHAVGPVARALHHSHHPSVSLLYGEDLSRSGVAPAPSQAIGLHEPLQSADPARGPPVPGELSTFAPGLEPLVRSYRPALRVPFVEAHAIASRLRTTISRSSWLVSSVIQAPSVPIMLSASAFLCSIISSILSSSVPTHTNLCTCTLRRWPIR